MSTNTRNSDTRPTGATRVAGAPNRRKWLLPLLVALAVLAALIFLVSRLGADDDPAPTAGTPTGAASALPAAPPAAASGAAQPDAGQAGSPGTVTAAGENLLSDPTAAGLGGHSGEQALGRAARVESVPADEGFWVGTSEKNRVWVQLTGVRGESDYKVKEGDSVDFTGTVTRADEGFAAKAGVTPAEGAGQLTDQGIYLLVQSSTVKLSD
jgi:hypothetical protein